MQANSTEILGWLLCAAVLGPFIAGLAAICFWDLHRTVVQEPENHRKTMGKWENHGKNHGKMKQHDELPFGNMVNYHKR